ncbi:hypothetical protein RFI_05659 [Reticulomyxa filosa]|uniref:USP domain-containing protein n=1 Tax=Reticulomyxa filosa TaxID=46433 RepID=X6NZZ7_RETFI|nr:hypothetical protein RFI_05659 [Reticulomyxa filosa]|eukprot:ETO31458.1 hypothetical protein RFI_05659 [Reticulomyxa filosa]
MTEKSEIDQVLTDALKEVTKTLFNVLEIEKDHKMIQKVWSDFFGGFKKRNRGSLEGLFLGEKKLLREEFRKQLAQCCEKYIKYRDKDNTKDNPLEDMAHGITKLLELKDIIHHSDLTIPRDLYDTCLEFGWKSGDNKERKKQLCDAIFNTLNHNAANPNSKSDPDIFYDFLEKLLQLVKECKVTNDYITIVFEDCLFGKQPLSSNTEKSGPMPNDSLSCVSLQVSDHRHLCTVPKLRERAFELLSTLLDQCEEKSIEHFLTKLVEHLDIFPHANEKWKDVSSCRRREHFVGLENLGSTCYLNSILQNLFMIPSFRERILSLPYGPHRGSFLLQLQRLFLRLAYSKRQTLNPKSFIDTVRSPGNRKIVPTEHMDCGEMMLQIFSQLEEQLIALQDNNNNNYYYY